MSSTLNHPEVRSKMVGKVPKTKVASGRQARIDCFFRPNSSSSSSNGNGSVVEPRPEVGPRQKDSTAVKDVVESVDFDDDKESKAIRTTMTTRFPAAFRGCGVGATWFRALQAEFEQPYFSRLDAFLASEMASGSEVYPRDAWGWTRHFSVEKTKVVILGQDPYHGRGQAHGLCFSVPRDGVPPPPSLVNIFKALEEDFPAGSGDGGPAFRKPRHGCLEGWADQGVLLLNACLTVRAGVANSHKDRGWEKVTDAAVKAVNDLCDPGVVFLLWGAYAQKKAASVDPRKHHLLKTVHPSPLSAHRGFFECGHFKACNRLLASSGRSPIDWSSLD